ncbi:MAG: CHASE2 domain-containing protein [Pseudomonadota bacterium]
MALTYRHPLENGVVNQKHFLTRQPSFLDNYITEEKNVFWSSTFFVVDADRVRRRWQLASLVCQDNFLTVVPSMQLLVALAQLYATDDSTHEAAQVIQQFKNRLNHWASTLPCDASQGTTIPRLCQQQECPPLIVELPTKAGISDKLHQVDLAGGRETERVVYRFAPPDTLDPNRLSFIIKKSARHVLAAGADVYQRIVLIGGTHQDTRDNHPVPIRIKDVDGIYIVANAIDTLFNADQGAIDKAIRLLEELVKDVEILRSGDLSAENRQALFKQYIGNYFALSYFYLLRDNGAKAFHTA